MTKCDCCACCAQVSASIIDGYLLCKFKGPVTSDYLCSKFKHYDSVNTEMKITTVKKCKDCSFFTISIVDEKQPDTNTNIILGTCSMFRVREYDGGNKNACSKIVLNCT